MMKRPVLSAILALLIVAAPGAGAVLADDASATLDVKLSVRGMTCSGCATSVKMVLEKVPGVTRAEVSLEKNEALVTYRKGKTTPEQLAKAVEKAGYKCSVRKEEGRGA